MEKVSDSAFRLLTTEIEYDDILSSSATVFREELRGVYKLGNEVYFYVGSIASIDFYAPVRFEKAEVSQKKE